MNDVKAIILCNNPIALPGIKEFLFFGKVGALVIPQRNKEMLHILEQMTQQAPAPIIRVDKKNYQQKITEAIKEYGITVGLMKTFPFILPPDIVQMPAQGFINFHYGLLPQCRGPQPVLWHLLRNDAETGVTVHKVDEGVDTGPIVIQEKMPIAPADTYGTLQGKLAWLGARLAANLLKILSYGSHVPAIAQDESKANYYEMPGAKEITINWKEMSSEQIIRLVNACNPWNKGAGAAINNWMIGILEAEITESISADDAVPGTIIACNKEDGLVVKTSEGLSLKINIIYTQEGYFSGYRLADFGARSGDRFS
jgi:methionyl-tRNA formyltransferase